jgi:cytochrome P450
VLSSANRDESQVPVADVLDLGRDPNRHLVFGNGIHYCLGAPLARMEGQTAIATLAHWTDLTGKIVAKGSNGAVAWC